MKIISCAMMVTISAKMESVPVKSNKRQGLFIGCQNACGNNHSCSLHFHYSGSPGLIISQEVRAKNGLGGEPVPDLDFYKWGKSIPDKCRTCHQSTGTKGQSKAWDHTLSPLNHVIHSANILLFHYFSIHSLPKVFKKQC